MSTDLIAKYHALSVELNNVRDELIEVYSWQELSKINPTLAMIKYHRDTGCSYTNSKCYIDNYMKTGIS